MNVTPPPIADTFIEVLRLFSSSNQTIKTDSSIYAYPIFYDSQINEISKMLNDGVSISGCCKYASALLTFDPAFVSAIENHQLSFRESQLGLVANTIAWIGSDKYCTGDFFLLLIRSIISDKFDEIRKFCLYIIIDHYKHFPPTDISEEAISLLTRYLLTIDIDPFIVIDLMHNLVKMSIKVKQKEISNIILRSISTLIYNNDSYFMQYNFQSLLNTCQKLFQDLSVEIISLLGFIAETTQKDYLLKYFSDLAVYIIKNFATKGKLIEVENLTPTDIFSEFITNFQMSFESFENCPLTIDALSNDCFDSPLTATDVLNNFQFSILNAFQPLLHLKEKRFIVSFLSSYAETIETSQSNNQFNIQSTPQNYQCVETLYFYLAILQNIPKCNLPDKIYEVLIDSVIFSPQFTLFYDRKHFQTVNLLRNMSISIVSKYCPSMINAILYRAVNYPFLFTENIARIHTNIPRNQRSVYLHPIMISNISLILQKLIAKMAENTSDMNQVFSAWSTILVCVNDLLNDQSTSIPFFSSFEFVNIFMRHFFHPSIRPLVFSTFRKYLLQPNAVLGEVAQFCLSIYHYALYDNENFHSLMTELLACLEDAIIHHQEILKELSIITPALLSFFLHFPTKELLKNTLNFLLLVSFNIDNFSFSHDEMLSLGKTIRGMESEGLSENTFSTLLSLLAGTKITNLSQSFAIKNPSFILLILNVSADDISQSVQFFYRLCKYSIFNCVQCHKGELDLLLIELVKNYPNSYEFLDCTFNSSLTKDELSSVVIPLLSLIFTYQCSPQSIEKFIGLVVPTIEPKQSNFDETDFFSAYGKVNTSFSPFADDALNKLITTVSNLHELHYVFTPNSSPLVYDKIHIEDISNGFSFSCYLMVDSAVSQDFSEKPIIFRIKDEKDSMLTLYSTGTTLLCEIKSDWGSSSASLTTEFPSCEWMMITITIRRKNECLLWLDFAANKDQGPPFTIRDPNFIGPLLTAQIGGYMPNSELSKNVSCFLGPFYLFNCHLNPAQVSSLYSVGPKGISECKDLLSDQNSKNSCDLYIKTFSHIFRKYNLVRNLIPFFGFSSCAPHYFLEKIVDIFRYIEPKECTQYFSVISQFLMKAQPKSIHYSLYLRFFNLYTETLSDELFKFILFNFDIWFNADDPNTVKRTVQHWTNVLFPDFYQAFLKNTSFSDILTLIRVHCWYTDTETDMINRSRCKNIDIEIIGNNLNRLLSKFATLRFTQDDIRSLLSNIFTIHDIQQKLSFLYLLSDVLPLITEYNEQNEVATELHMLFTTSRADIFSITLSIIMELAAKTGKIGEHIECILFHINRQHFTTSILDAVIECSKKYPEAIPIVCLIACNLPENIKLKTIEAYSKIIEESIHAREKITKIKTWYIWPIILTIKVVSSKEHQDLSINSIVSIMMANTSIIDCVLGFLDLLYIHYQTNVTTYQLEIIDKIIFEYLKSPKYQTNEALYRFCRYLLFKYDNSLHSVQLMSDYHFSPFTGNLPKYDSIDDFISLCQRQRTLSTSIDTGICSMNNINKLFSLKAIKADLIFRVEVDIENTEIFDRILSNIMKFHEISSNDQSLGNYVRFLKYLKNKQLYNETEKFKFLMSFSTESWRNFQVMNIAFKNFMNRYCSELDKIILKRKIRADNLLSNLRDETIQISLTSADLLREKKHSQYAQDINLFNRFEYQFMNEFSIWHQFSYFSKVRKDDKSFHLLNNFSCPFVKQRLKIYQIEIDPFTVRTKPILYKPAAYMKLNIVQNCTFIVLPSKIMIVTRTKCINIAVTEIGYILYRHVNCYEFVKKTGKSYVVNFLRTPIESIAKALKQMTTYPDIPSPVIQTKVSFSSFINQLNITNDWISGKLSNFEYLLKLNFFGGRSYQMLANYPIFPFIRDFSDNSIGYNVSPQTWLKMFPPFSSIFDNQQNSETTQTLDNNDLVQFDFKLTDSYVEITTEEEEHQIDENNCDINTNSNDISYDKSSENSNENTNGNDDLNLFTREQFLSTLEKNALELTPEFYIMPECFSSLRLPNGQSKYEFVYENRKQLESDDVSSKLHIWIDRLFGPNGRIVPLFKSPHPQRNVQFSQEVISQFYAKLTPENLIFGKMVLNVNSDKLIVKAISSKGNCSEFVVDFTKKNFETLSQLSINISPHSIISANSDELLLIDPETSILSIIRGMKIANTPIQLTVDFSEDDAVFGSNDGTVFAVETENNKCYLLGQCKVSPELIVAIASSKQYGRIAVAVRSGKIILFERRTGEFIRVIMDDSTSGVPAKRILITEGFGFIVAEFPDEIVLFSMTGDKIRSLKINFEILYMTNHLSSNGLDYLIIADTRRVLVLEAFKLNIVQEIKHHLNCRILDIKYVTPIGCLVLFTQDGKLFNLK
ncbi:hypothetical protein TRFO_12933 [Tritrichomonas foetus]|uniref:BEACH domain-containing protein n=1 Tax=Tritrichomonas foetus TaxID=1144522 RepID=A0A1J4L002_9EUKA|nr:hypothetical protein TRFO_12933 [Tritrichomonas foetus]|eukprot:OHT16839.1 hypothetical protein TRFO_12933 [Tritrichomonas foetus]